MNTVMVTQQESSSFVPGTFSDIPDNSDSDLYSNLENVETPGNLKCTSRAYDCIGCLRLLEGGGQNIFDYNTNIVLSLTNRINLDTSHSLFEAQFALL